MFDSTVLDRTDAPATQPPLITEGAYDDTIEGTIQQVEAKGAATVPTEPPTAPPAEQKTGRIVSAQVLRDETGAPRRGPSGGILVGAVFEANCDMPIKLESKQRDGSIKKVTETTYSTGKKGTGTLDKKGLEIKVTGRVFVDNPEAAVKQFDSI